MEIDSPNRVVKRKAEEALQSPMEKKNASPHFSSFPIVTDRSNR